MNKNTKSSITLPPAELEMVNGLMKSLKAKSKVDVIRRGLKLLKESTERQSLRIAFKQASDSTRSDLLEELTELEGVTLDGLD